MEGRGVEPLTGSGPESATGTARPPYERDGLNSRPFRLNDGGGGDLQRWLHALSDPYLIKFRANRSQFKCFI